ncbi:MAG: NAD-dependent epimerase/dehydratase family protein [Acetatifactor sp.]|nr:NAD-dependent epimerase/dehydratase family protein [Acetatifactor sp.]
MEQAVRRILITGVNSYVGNSVEAYLKEYNSVQGRELYRVGKCSLREKSWEQESWNGYDAVLHMVGIAHADIGHVSEETKRRYYEINRDLAVRAAEKAKREGVRQFVYMSSVIVYGDSATVGKGKKITEETEPSPANFYGDSKWQAEKALKKLEDASFAIAIVRAPMIYGRGSKGNFPLLAKLAEKTPIFPSINNERSMLYIENLAEFFRLLVESGRGGVFFPQNREYVTTSQMVQMIAAAKGQRIRPWRVINPLVKLAGKMPGKIGGMVNKAFGSLTIDQELSVRDIDGYRRYSLEESIGRIYES